VAGNPDLGELTTPQQQPVDFGVWQAADGAWQLWACMRGTAVGWLLYGWQGESLEQEHWSDYTIVSEGGRAGNGNVNAESPFVIFIDDFTICSGQPRGAIHVEPMFTDPKRHIILVSMTIQN